MEVPKNRISITVEQRQSQDTSKAQEETKQTEGRTYSNLSKKVAKIAGGIVLGVAGVVSVAALIVGIMMLVNPAGFGISNAIGAGIAAASKSLIVALATATAWVKVNALIVTIAGSIGLGVVAAAAAAAAIIPKCSAKSEKKPEGTLPEVEKSTEGQEEVDSTETEEATVEQASNPGAQEENSSIDQKTA